MKKILIFIVVLTATSLISGVAYSKVKGAISGQVTGASGNGMANVSVNAFDRYDNWTASSSTDGNGYYSLIVPIGTYTLYFSPPSYSGYYAPGWYHSNSNSDIPDIVTVAAFRTTSNIDTQLKMGGTIYGRVTNPSGDGIANVYVGGIDQDGRWVPGPFTDNNGDYSFNLPVGTYRVHFSSTSSSGYYAPEWYEDKQGADVVTVEALQTTSNIDAQLEVGGKISGRVTDASGNGISNVCVNVFDPNEDWIDNSCTDINGEYSLNVPVGTWKVRFSPSSSGYYAPEWYNNKSLFDVADLVAVTEFQTISNINAQPEIWGKISGRVTDVSRNGIANVYVYAYDLSNNLIDGDRTDSQGFYTILLPAGKYKVGIFTESEAKNDAVEWYNNKSDFQSADKVMVIKGVTHLINAQLPDR